MKKESLLTIVGIGASAGGFKALKDFFMDIPDQTGVAYVIVMHLSPEHKSVLAELLQPHIKMPVQQVTQSTELKADHVYVIPPGSNLNTIDTHLRLSKIEERRSERAPIDHFFNTLAETHNGSSIGIILTGTGSDGTLGMKKIKEKGGLTIVQSPVEAEFDGMPQSVISTGLVDLVLPVKEMAGYLVRYINTTPRLKMLDPGQGRNEEETHILQKIFAQVRARTRRDFSRYKISTLLRRIQRRMQIYHIEQLSDYLELIRRNPEEVITLSDDFLINVTNFFRDAAVFEYMGQKVIPEITKNRKPNEQVRIWSIGCATGEEAYSLAIMFLEVVAKMDNPPSVQIFASDLHERSLAKAREGFFPGDIKIDVSSERLKKYFTREDGGYRIRKDLREMVIFTPHNLLGDPPFSRLDLVVCRNLLIYLKREVQRDVFELLHYALLPGGYMILGTSENLESTDLFKIENKELSVYKKKDVSGPEPRLPVFPTVKSHFREERPVADETNTISYGGIHHQLIERYGPPSLLISPDYQVLHVSENAGRYLNIPGGELSKDVFKLVRKELMLELRSTIYTSKEQDKMIRSQGVQMDINGNNRKVFISSRIVREKDRDNLILVLFEEYDEHEISKSNNKQQLHENVQDHRIEQLEDELNESRQRLQAIIEEYETSREEMKASNEELQSANEELRSTLEELETSKEELQSMNEELTTLNQENRHKVEELSRLSDDLQNLMAATDIATLFLNRDLRILRYTPKLGELFNVRIADVGRPISDITNKLGYDRLGQEAKKVLKDLQPIKKEVSDQDGNKYLVRVLPYRSTEDKIDGVVITFIDITAIKATEEKLRKSEARFRALVQSSSSVIYRMSPDWKVMQELEGKGFLADTIRKSDNWLNEYIHPDDQKKVLEEINKAIRDKKMFSYEHRVRKADGTLGWTFSQAVPLLNEKGEITEWFGAASNITSRKHNEKEVAQAREFAENIVETLHEPLLMLVPDLTIKSANPAFYSHFEVNKKDTEGTLIYELGNGQWDIPALRKLLEEVLPDNKVFNDFEVEHTFEQIGKRVMLVNARRLDHEQLILLGIRDITDRKDFESKLKTAKEEAEHLALAKEEFLAHISHEIRTPLNAVIGLSHLMLKQSSGDKQTENLETLRTLAENLERLINNILDITKIRAGKMVVTSEETRLTDYIKKIIGMHQVFADRQKLTLKCYVDPKMPSYIICDQLKLSQVLNNLLSNAIKFTTQGEVSLSVSNQRQEKDQVWLKFEVDDTGIGIPKEKLESVFEIFSQADNSTAREYGGTGLGLTLTKLYLEMMGSQIHVESTQGAGSKFYFVLQVKISDGSQVKKIQKEPIKTNLEQMKILVVEDDMFNRVVFSQLFRLWNISTDEAVDGWEALKKAQQNKYDLILMDVRMPVMDGFESARKIRKLQNYQGIPIVAITADMSEKVKKEVAKGLFDDIIVKPIDPDKLKPKLNEIFSRTGKN